MSLQKALYAIRGAAHEQLGLADQCVHAPKLKVSSLQNATDLAAAADVLEAQANAIRAIKKTCLTATDGRAALGHIVRLCIDAGCTDHLDQL